MFLSVINTPDLFGTLKGTLRATVYVLFSVVVYTVVQNTTTLKRLFLASFPSAAVAVIWTVIVLVYHIDAWQWTSAYRSAPVYELLRLWGIHRTFLSCVPQSLPI